MHLKIGNKWLAWRAYKLIQEIFNTLKAMYSIPFDDIRLYRDMIGYVCIVF